MGTVYELYNDYDKAVESYQQAVEASRRIGDLALESNALNPLSAIYFKRGDEDLAIKTIERSVSLKVQTNDLRGLGFALYGRGKLHCRHGKYSLAISDFTEAIGIMSDAGDQLGLGMANNKLGVAYMETGEYQLARVYFMKALYLSDHVKFQVVRFRVYHNLYELAKMEGDAEQALDYLEKYFECKDAVIDKETYNLIKSYEAVSQIEKLEFEAKRQKEKNEIIERKNAELDSFFYRVSHDIKGPISSLMGLSELVKMEITQPESLKLFDMYHSQIVRVNNIVMGLINLTRISNLEERMSVIDFHKLVNDCIDSCKYLPQFNSVRVEKEIEAIGFKSEWAIINTILQNLIENAIKYSRSQAGPFVRIAIFSEVNAIVIQVEDNGLGIDEGNRGNIFNMFFRGTSHSQGSGLGLYILKRAVERLNGNIEVNSVVGKGSTFTVRLPHEA